MSVKINLNSIIKVKLTDLGRDIYYHRVDDLNEYFGCEKFKPTYPEVDSEGYTEFQLWGFMELYGTHIGMAKPNVIEPIEIICDDAEPERPKGHWIPMQVSSGRDSWKCSVCGRRARGKIENLPFCHCGADMRGET